VRVAEGSRRITVPARDSVEIAGGSLLEHFIDLTYSYRFGPPGFDVAVGQLLDAESQAPLGECFHFPGTLPVDRSAELGLEAVAEPAGDNVWALIMRTRRLAQAVAIEVPGFLPDDSYFHLAPGAERRVLLRASAAGIRLQGVVRPFNAPVPARIVLQAPPRSEPS
jgi:beta-mannosidase